VGSFIIFTHPKISLADQTKENEVGRACGMNGTGEKHVQGFGGKAWKKKTTWKTDLYMRGMDLGEIGWTGMEWIQLAQDRGLVVGSCEHSDELLGSGTTELGSIQMRDNNV
jgi:hypothetical protein